MGFAQGVCLLMEWLRMVQLLVSRKEDISQPMLLLTEIVNTDGPNPSS